ncbi:hypothetical protein HGP17_11165 [Rhizobium sp. P38BS-XIX]|uniref:hypothetical protein n=1 Tax=Rhizobium sp. P38BS-XIX TaxID=2726740 RepID=UPI001456D668|nr:hypothetical protein [Rhizobium sp. P38BS-XIX]NLR97385.1 hypothetical protein [Rhizobium sp. P38BS-XIX]
MNDTDGSAPASEPARNQTTAKMIPTDVKRKGHLLIAFDAAHEDQFAALIDKLGGSPRPLVSRDGKARKFILSNIRYSQLDEIQGDFFYKWLRHRPEPETVRKPCSGDCSASGKCLRPGCICLNGRCT